MEKRRVHIFTCALGRTSFWKKKAPTATPLIRTIRGDMALSSDIPEAFMAVSSNFSPKFPKVISDASRMARGSAMGTMLRAA